ncbi:MAG: electron transfer flavoprotein-ubiquinone oxidoreductase [Thermodesulfobacteriota bacterium]|jgi:electron-transferring-flavoprotein dehydrogenase
MSEHEVMDVDVLFVGGGIASLSGAYHLSNLIKQHNEKIDQGGSGQKISDEFMIAVLEKGAYIGAHGISGAVINPVALKELIPDFIEQGAPLEGEVKKENIYFLTKTGKIKSPITPPPMNNHGNFVVSLSRLVEWLGQKVEEQGVTIFPSFAGTEVLYENGKVIGVRTGDKGIDADGSQKSNFEPGIDLHAKVTVFGDGSRGNLTKTLIQKFNLAEGKNGQGYEVGVKEIWEMPDDRIRPGQVIETMGFPLKADTFGGGFIYGMRDNRITIGLLTSLDYPDPCMDPHREFQKFKTHPFIAGLLKDGKMVQYGAKTVPVSGLFSMPEPVFDGGLLVGDAACLFNGMKIKGVHYAMKSGMLAAETIMDCLINDDFSFNRLKNYKTLIEKSYIFKELRKVRNFHQAFQKGFWPGMVKVGFQFLLGGRILKDRLPAGPDFKHMKTIPNYYQTKTPSDEKKGDIKYDGALTFDKVSDVYYAGATHEEKQPPHLKIGDLGICYERCREEYGNPCVRFCPAGVYEMEIEESTGKPKMIINFSNCVHCKTCDVKDPYENITWVPPEGGGGPKYTMT